MATRFDIDQPSVERNFKYFRIRMAINAVQIWVNKAFRLVPTNVLIFRFCLIVLKKISICHRSLYMLAMVVAPNARWFVKRTITRSFSASQTSTRLKVCGHFLNDS